MAQDYYDLLGVSKNADKAEIKRAFRKLAREWHPDVSKHENAEEKFKELKEAYEVLSNDQTRARYDRFGPDGVRGGGGYAGASGMGGFEDIFEEFFNNFAGTAQRARRGPRPGADRRLDVTITFEESIFGVEKEIEYDRLEVCETCGGTGAAEGTSPIQCPVCKGAGEIRQVQQSFLGSVVRMSTCPQCGGRGTIVETPCNDCTGSGRLRQRVKRTIQIPAGVREGLQIQIPGGGDVGESQQAIPGNLYVVVHVKEHEFFRRRDNDIILEVNVNVAQAALGDRVTIPTVDGQVELKIPNGTQTGKVFRLRGKGAPRLRSDGTSAGKGDQLVYISVDIPQTLTDEQHELFERLAETMGHEVEVQSQKNGRGFLDRMMDFFGGEE
jgi:molecular chaperone DnaJ